MASAIDCRRDFTPNRFGRRPWKRSNETLKNVLPFRPISEPKSPGADPGGKQRLQRARPAIVGAARDARTARPHRPKRSRRDRIENIAEPPAGARTTARRAPEWLTPARAAGARRDPARQGAARPVAGGRADLPARPAALRQPRVPRAHRLWQPARARGGRRSRRALRRTRRLLGLQHVRYRHAGDDFRQPGFVASERRRRRPLRVSTRLPGTTMRRWR